MSVTELDEKIFGDEPRRHEEHGDENLSPYPRVSVVRDQFTTTSPAIFGATGDGGAAAGGAAATGACAPGLPRRAFISSSAPANSCSLVILPASTSARIALCAWYSLLTI